MISVAKPWLICDYHGLTIVTMVFGFICGKKQLFFGYWTLNKTLTATQKPSLFEELVHLKLQMK